MRICPVSGNSIWKPLYYSSTGRIMTGDQRIGQGNLRKIICSECGAVANERAFTPEELEVLYGREYELNTLGKEEHYFYTASGPVARSKVFFDWIKAYLPGNFETLIEIGCGEGNLLGKFADMFPQKTVIGFDGSTRAVELAKSKGLHVQQKLLLGDMSLPQADVFILVNVIEHIEDIVHLLSNLRTALNKGGKIIFCLPVQDYGGYDIFFAEHVWHFTSNHFLAILERNGLEVVHSDVDHPVNHGIGLFVCEKTENVKLTNIAYSNIIESNLNFWKNNFEKLDNFLKTRLHPKIAVFGAGEVSTLFLTFTSLGKYNVIACVDDTKKSDDRKHGIPIFGSDWLQDNPVDLLLLAVNKKYHEIIKNKFINLNLNIQPIY